MSYNVLIVDDSRTTRTVITKALRHSGVELGDVFEAEDGLEALERLDDAWVDIVFADLNMPGMSGVELVERMADTDLLSSVPVVIVSTESRPDRIDALLARGAAAYVRKPFAPELLGSTVRELLTHRANPPSPDRLSQGFFEAIEGFTMLVALPVATPPAPPDMASAAWMQLTSATSHADVAIVTDSRAAALLAQSATGQIMGADGLDALKELLNVMCGVLVKSLDGGPYSMSPPEARSLDGRTGWAHVLGMATSLTFDAEGIPLIIGFTFSERW